MCSSVRSKSAIKAAASAVEELCCKSKAEQENEQGGQVNDLPACALPILRLLRLYQCGKTTVSKEVLCCLARSIDFFFIDAVQLSGTVALENKLYLAHAIQQPNQQRGVFRQLFLSVRIVIPISLSAENHQIAEFLQMAAVDFINSLKSILKSAFCILREWKASQDKQKAFLGDEYLDYGLVIALPNGRPCEETVINNAFRRLKKEANLPNVVFHSLRHSSTTYKLKLNHGDLKATQGDTGHSQVDMITKIYAHILDEDRKVNAQKFESAFYANPDLRSVHAPQEEKTQPLLDAQTLLSQLQQSPELLSNLTSLILAQAGR